MNNGTQPMRYLEQQHCSKQWRLVIDALSSVLATLEPTQKQLLMHRTGAEMARSLTLEVQPSLAALNKLLNEFWYDLDWGYVEIGLRQDKLYLEHYHTPVPYGRCDSHAYVALSLLLEGFYSEVLEQQGGEANAKVLFMQSGNPMIFEYKNQEHT